MNLLFAIEASRPDGTVFRVALGVTLFLPVASLVAALTRLF